jgi:site-specific DNA-methyltransferase (adenine-specific)
MLTAVMLIQRPNSPIPEQLPEAKASRLFLGDCIKVLPGLADNSINCIITDPPYGISYKSLSHKLKLKSIANDGKEAYGILDRALSIAVRKLKNGHHIYVFTNWQAYPSMRDVFERYFTLKNLITWDKGSGTRGDLKGNYGYRTELIMYGCNGEKRNPLFGRRDDNILFFKKVPSVHMQHPTEKPVELLKYLIEKSSAAGDTILDMFAGAGSTLVAAKELGRRYVGIELEKTWYDVAARRLGLTVVQ